MSMISVTDLTFGYEGSMDMVFEGVSFQFDTDWKLGFIGRNGKGKTTFLNLLLGKYEYRGSISATTCFDYFPYTITAEQEEQTAAELFEVLRPNVEMWQVLRELDGLELDAECLYRPFGTLSHGERTKAMLALLFSQDNFFLLIDEPTNHLDAHAREVVKQYLGRKKGFLLVSHDRNLLDACIDHVLVLNRNSIRVEKGNFSSWWENKEKMDRFNRAENEKHLNEIGKLKETADRISRWAEKSEATKIGFDPVKEHDRTKNTRSYIGAKTKKMQSQVKNTQHRIQAEIEQKEGLLQDIETVTDLKLMPMDFYKEIYVQAEDYSVNYGDKEVIKNLLFTLKKGERVQFRGENGCGKSTLIKAILKENAISNLPDSVEKPLRTVGNTKGKLSVPRGLTISYVNQDTSHLRGTLQEYADLQGVDYSLLLALLRQLDFERGRFNGKIEEYSEGQKKKVLLAASLLKPAHLYIWDEPLNYIDVFSRMQLENLILKYCPTMIFVEHDAVFSEKIATRTLNM